ncbi:hypothetical protein [Ferruginibacter profundus]
MGPDITICTNNSKEIYSGDYHDPKHDYFNKHSLSRTFCNLMCRLYVISGDTELEQIGKITSVDISPILAMDTYGSDSGEELEFFLETADTEEERQKISDRAKQQKENLKGNIDKVLQTIDALIVKLSSIDNLHKLLDDHGEDTLDNKYYFADFNIDKGKGYIGNNFGQDLRNFKRFLEYAKSKGSITTYFNYG